MKPLTQQQRARLIEASEHIRHGRYPEAVAACRELLRAAGHHPDVLMQLANAQVALGRHAEAQRNVERVIQAAPDAAAPRLLLAMCQANLNEYDRAMASINEALLRQPGYVEAITKKAQIHHFRGEHEAGHELLRPWVENGEAHPELLFEYGRLATILGHHDKAEAALRRVIEGPHTAPATRVNARFELASVLDRAGRYEPAWWMCKAANEAQPSHFRPDAHDAMIDAVIEAWTPEAIAAAPRSTVDSELPVFVVGMPRSGTSLVEQILASHPDVHGAGELPHLFRLVNDMQAHDDGQPARVDDLAALTPGALNKAARAYLKKVRPLDRSAARIVDKQPFNFLYIGLISLMFPKARIVHCVREPLDMAISCYFQSFMGRMYFANRIEHIGVMYRSYVRLMEHWRAVLDAPMLDVVYEDVTGDQEAQSRRLIEFVGLTWDDACLRFHETKRTAWTASIDQVRKPMYRTSVERWRNYAERIGPLREAMGLAAPEPEPTKVEPSSEPETTEPRGGVLRSLFGKGRRES